MGDISVTVLGAGGEIGKCLTMLLKNDPAIKHISLYDIGNVGIAVDAHYIPTRATITGHQGKANLKASLTGANMIILIAGIPWKEGITREAMLQKNSVIVQDLLLEAIRTCPSAHVLVVSNPVNSIVPFAYELYQAEGVANPSIFGITTLDVVRCRIVVGELTGVAPLDVDIDVIGGHSDKTIFPILSSKALGLTDEEQDWARQEIVNCVYKVATAKDNKASASLSMAWAVWLFLSDLSLALQGKPTRIPLVAFVKSEDNDTGYLSRRLIVGKNGLEGVEPLPVLSKKEEALYLDVRSAVQADVALGEGLAKELFWDMPVNSHRFH